MEHSKPGEGQGGESGRLIFSSHGHLLGLADGVLFGGRRPPCKHGPAAPQGKVPAADSAGGAAKCPDGHAPAG